MYHRDENADILNKIEWEMIAQQTRKNRLSRIKCGTQN